MQTTSRHARTSADRGIVTSPHRAASEDGAAVLAAGGSAVDAAIAASATLAVVYPHMTSIGGDAFWLVWDPAAGVPRFLNGGGRAAARGHHRVVPRARLRRDPAARGRAGHDDVPGQPSTTWCAAHAAYGRVPLARALAPAIDYAREGFPVTGASRTGPRRRRACSRRARTRRASSCRAAGRRPRARGSQPGPRADAGAHRRASGHAGFYAGETARELARFAAERGGLFTADDLAAQRRDVGRAAVHRSTAASRLRDAAAHPGRRRAPDAEPAGAGGPRGDAVPRRPITSTRSSRPSRSPSTTATAWSRTPTSCPCRSSGCCRAPTPTSDGG